MKNVAILLEINKFIQDNLNPEDFKLYKHKINNLRVKESELLNLSKEDFEEILNNEIDELHEFILQSKKKSSLLKKLKKNNPVLYSKLPLDENKKIDIKTSDPFLINEKEYWETGWNLCKKINSNTFTKKWFLQQKGFKKMLILKTINSPTNSNFKLFKIILNPGENLLKEDILNLLIYISIRSKKGYKDFIENPDNYGKILFNPFNEFTLFNFLEFFEHEEIENIWKEIEGENIIRRLTEIEINELNETFPKTIRNFKLRKFI